MKNITLSLVGQSVLSEILIEIVHLTNLQVELYKSFDDFHNKVFDQSNKIIITSLENYNSIKKNKILIPILYINNKENINKLKFKNIEIINIPIQIRNIIERVKLIYLKSQFSGNSKIDLLGYKINLNNREIVKNGNKLKLTEREIDFLIFLKNSKNPQSINSILESVWGYAKGLDTHTIETHVHRLRKKFLNCFKENNLIKNNKKGYFI